MHSRREISFAFRRDLASPLAQDKDLWFIRGDFDHFKMFNDLYGCLLADYVLDWAVEALAAAVRAFEQRHACGPILMNVAGDDLTLYLPPSELCESDIAGLLEQLRRVCMDSFRRKYGVAAVQWHQQWAKTVPLGAWEKLKNTLERRDMALDFAPRKRGCLMLWPVGERLDYEGEAAEVARLLQATLRTPATAFVLHWDWLCDPQTKTFRTFNQGFLCPPAISFAAYSAKKFFAPDGMASLSRLSDARLDMLFERLSAGCHAVLRECKTKQRGVSVNAEAGPAMKGGNSLEAANCPGQKPGLRLASERYLREKLYLQNLSGTTLFRINARYHAEAFEQSPQPARDRGRKVGPGATLKELNNGYGPDLADRVIRRLILAFAEAMPEALGFALSNPDELTVALFADKFTVASRHRSLLTPPQITAVGQRLIENFNRSAQEVKVAHLQMTIARAGPPMAGFRLLHRLDLAPYAASAGPQPAQIDLRQFCREAALAGEEAVEEKAFFSGRQLMTGSGLQSPAQFSRTAVSSLT